jgi:hypothetical protein
MTRFDWRTTKSLQPGTRVFSDFIDKNLGALVYGGIDGCVTTFAVVSGEVGASLGILLCWRLDRGFD